MKKGYATLKKKLHKVIGDDKELIEERLFAIQLVASLADYCDSVDPICRQQSLI